MFIKQAAEIQHDDIPLLKGQVYLQVRNMHGSAACSQKAIITQVIGLINVGEMAVIKIIFSASP